MDVECSTISLFFCSGWFSHHFGIKQHSVFFLKKKKKKKKKKKGGVKVI